MNDTISDAYGALDRSISCSCRSSASWNHGYVGTSAGRQAVRYIHSIADRRGPTRHFQSDPRWCVPAWVYMQLRRPTEEPKCSGIMTHGTPPPLSLLSVLSSWRIKPINNDPAPVLIHTPSHCDVSQAIKWLSLRNPVPRPVTGRDADDKNNDTNDTLGPTCQRPPAPVCRTNASCCESKSIWPCTLIVWKKKMLYHFDK
jgi:hypothetical protein